MPESPPLDRAPRADAPDPAPSHAEVALALRLAAIVEATAEIVWTNDPTGRMVGEQPGWAAFTGQAFEAYQGHGWSAAVHPDDAPATLAAWTRAVAERRTFVTEHRVRRHDGVWRTFAVRAVPVFAADGGAPGRGAIVEWVGVHRDITEERAREAALRASEERYALAARATHNAIWDWDLATGALAWNDGVHTVFGHVPGSVPPRVDWWYETIHPDDRARVVASIQQVIDWRPGDPGDGQGWQAEYRFRVGALRGDVGGAGDLGDVAGAAAPGARYAVVIDRGYVARDAAGRPVRMIGAMADVTRERAAEAERARLLAAERRARAEAEAERQRLAAVLDQLPLGVIVAAADGGIVTYNRALPPMFGHALHAAAQMSDYAAFGGVHVDGRPYAPEDYPIARALLHGELVDQELTCYRRGDGTETMLAISAAPVRDETGAVRYAVAAVQDVREREATRAVAEAERRRAEEANRAKAEFLANMSHELRTPLNAIGGHVQLIELGLHGPVTAEQAAALARVQGAQRHLLRLINDVLNFAKLEAGKIVYDVRAVRLGDVVAEVTPLVEPLMAARRQAFAVALREPDVEVWADREKLPQVLLNLLSNAVKFTPEGGRIVVDTPVADDGSTERDALHLRVADTGRGIPRAKLESVFEPFVQVDSGRTRTTEGTGLGLAISRDLARGMGGELRARSVEGEGSAFTLTLRRVVATDGTPVDRRVRSATRVEERRGAAAPGAEEGVTHG